MHRTHALPILALSFLAVAISPLAAVDLTGRWDADFERTDKVRKYYVDMVQTDDGITGALVSPRTRAYPFTSASLDGHELKILIERRYKGEDVVFDIRAEVRFDGITGTVHIGDEQFAKLRMERLPDPVGTWNAKAWIPGDAEPRQAQLELERAPEGFAGKFTSERGEVELEESGWKNDRVVLRFPLQIEGEERQIQIEAKFTDENTLEGEWFVQETDIFGDWSATRSGEVELVGEWDVEVETNEGRRSGEMKIAAKDGQLVATYGGSEDFGRVKHKSISRDGDKVTFEIVVELDDRDVPIVVRTELEKPGRLVGRWSAGDDDGAWSATRKVVAKPAAPPVSFAGTWSSKTIAGEDREIEFDLKLTGAAEDLAGEATFHADDGDTTVRLQNLRASGHRLRFSFELDFGGTLVEIQMSGRVTGDEIEGRWQTENGQGARWSGQRARKRETL